MKIKKFTLIPILLTIILLGGLYQVFENNSEPQPSVNGLKSISYSHRYLNWFTGIALLRGTFYSNRDVHISYDIIRDVDNLGSLTGPFKSEFDLMLSNAFGDWEEISDPVLKITNWDTKTSSDSGCDWGYVQKLEANYTDSSTNVIQIQEGLLNNWSCSQSGIDAVESKTVEPAMGFYDSFLINLSKAELKKKPTNNIDYGLPLIVFSIGFVIALVVSLKYVKRKKT